MKTYNLSVHYHNDPDDNLGYDDEIMAEDLDDALEKVRQIDDFDDFYYYVVESEDGSDYYNSSEEDGWVCEDEC